jgi:hypothetical protein
MPVLSCEVLVYGVECVVLNGEYSGGWSVWELGFVGLCLVVLFEKGESISRG